MYLSRHFVSFIPPALSDAAEIASSLSLCSSPFHSHIAVNEAMTGTRAAGGGASSGTRVRELFYVRLARVEGEILFFALRPLPALFLSSGKPT